MTLIPEGFEAEAKSNPLEIIKTKRTSMIKKAKELLTEPMEFKDLMNALEQYYVTEKNEHYTSAQLKDIVKQVESDIAPKIVKVEL